MGCHAPVQPCLSTADAQHCSAMPCTAMRLQRRALPCHSTIMLSNTIPQSCHVPAMPCMDENWNGEWDMAHLDLQRQSADQLLDEGQDEGTA